MVKDFAIFALYHIFIGLILSITYRAAESLLVSHYSSLDSAKMLGMGVISCSTAGNFRKDLKDCSGCLTR
jgi:hypothetical protein